MDFWELFQDRWLEDTRTRAAGNSTPALEISWDSKQMKFSGKDSREKLPNGNHSIEVGSVNENKISVTVWVMKPGQKKIVAKRLKEELSVAGV